MAWAPLLHSICRNLIGRVYFAAHISWSKLKWVGDSLIITLARDKTNQEGDEKKTVRRHVYCNRKEPRSDMIFFVGLRIISEMGAHKSVYICGNEAQDSTTDKSTSKDGAFGALFRAVIEVTNITFHVFFF
jgi:hypothetical protein